MGQPASKRIFINFVVKLLLIFAVIGGGVALLYYNKDNTVYFRQTQRQVAGLIELNGALQKASHAYLNFADGDTTQLDSLKKYQKLITQSKKVLASFANANEIYNHEALQITKNLAEEENFYTIQLELSAQAHGNLTPKPAFSHKIGSTAPLIIQLVKLLRDDLKSRISQNDSFYEKLGYLVIAVGGLILIMVVVLYNRSQRGLRRQLLHDKEIYEAKLSAQAANNAKTEYLGMISHEIRTPMNGVLGMSNLLLQGTLSAEQREYAKTISNSAESLLRIVNDILDFSKIEVGKIHLDATSVNIRALIAETFAQNLPPSTPQLSISFKVDKNVPNAIYCDPKRLKQVLLNFLSNAVKFTEKGHIILECAVIDKDEFGKIRLGFVTKDTGIGIAEDRIKQLFKPFVQIDQSTMRKYGGTGLGLNIAYNLITMMGGKVKVKSEVGKGSAFTFFITTNEAVEKKAPKLPKEENKSVLDDKLSSHYPFKILVVDDNEINLMLIIKTLGKLGYECKKASNGQIAVDMVKQEHFDLIFMDMQMPIMDGTVATTEIRKHYRVYEFPVVVALTANTLGDGKDKCLEAGMQDFIAKPFKPAEIEEVIRKWAPKIIEYKSKHQSN
ncbi:response regulator [Pedobacter sp. SL55]|uniref:response regulator n=1 Tax=Pedobacter sp. SL55 TaxID=2995161 RepID=UPI00226EB1D4|nr:response regulator [Pedobacter sp. SL55]WAC40654.1 ATP-binding protein [Pedobacter sp. SL55]